MCWNEKSDNLAEKLAQDCLLILYVDFDRMWTSPEYQTCQASQFFPNQPPTTYSKTTTTTQTLVGFCNVRATEHWTTQLQTQDKA